MISQSVRKTWKWQKWSQMFFPPHPDFMRLLCLFKGCWPISTSRRIQTNYASSPVRANLLRWISRKPCPPWSSLGDWHCQCCWQKTAGSCTWEPGCAGRCWAGCGWTLFPNKSGPVCHDETHKRLETVPFFLYRDTMYAPDAEQYVIRGSEIFLFVFQFDCLTGDTEKC